MRMTLFDAADVDMLANRIARSRIRTVVAAGCRIRLERRQRVIDLEDHRVWVKDLKHTWYGDANLERRFNSKDFVQVFQAGKYEQAG